MGKLFKNKKAEKTSIQADARLPEFIIVGAMKAGTSSLHYILNQHEHIFIPDREIFFFDIDDIKQHPDFFIETPQKWFFPCEQNFDKYLSWYKSFFKDAEESQIIGEDSTTYMASQKAPSRISKILPEVKLIFMLRDPVSRTYSHYWHLVRTGRAIYDFEKTIQYMAGTLLQRSFYKVQIERFKKFFPDINMKFIIFEDFIKNTQVCIDEICKFLNLESSIDISQLDIHKNLAKVPRSVELQIVHNRIFRSLTAKKYVDALPNANVASDKSDRVLKTADKLFKKINLTSRKSYPSMKPKTKRFLQKLFAKENRGLSDLIGRSIHEYWLYVEN